jgi:phosphoribosylanthranilate isomerase
MSISVKICGLTSIEALEAAIRAGADYVGFVFFERSPRYLPLDRAAALASEARGRVKTVALTVDADDRMIGSIVDTLAPDFLQLHGQEDVERTAYVGEMTKTPVIKAIKVGVPEHIRLARTYEAVADHLLFDAQAGHIPNALPGGNGISFDWTWLSDAGLRPNFLLSGGLNSDNVRAALQASGASSVDVSSGVETAPGAKSPAMIKKFVETARSFQRAA